MLEDVVFCYFFVSFFSVGAFPPHTFLLQHIIILCHHLSRILCHVWQHYPNNGMGDCCNQGRVGQSKEVGVQVVAKKEKKGVCKTHMCTLSVPTHALSWAHNMHKYATCRAASRSSVLILLLIVLLPLCLARWSKYNVHPHTCTHMTNDTHMHCLLHRCHQHTQTAQKYTQLFSSIRSYSKAYITA